MSKSINEKLSDLLIFIIIYGWEGPLAVYMGFKDHEIGLIIAGVLITLFLWGMLGSVVVTSLFEK